VLWLTLQDEDMREVVNWISANVPFDRLYFYGSNRPIHISFSAALKRKIIELIQTTNGKNTPRVWRKHSQG
jgi:hypothetical protein